MDMHVGRALVVQKRRERATGTFKQAGGLPAVLGGAERQLAKPLLLELEIEQPGHFFEGLDKDGPARPSAGQRRLLELSRSFAALSRPHQEAVAGLARALAGAAAGPEEGEAWAA